MSRATGAVAVVANMAAPALEAGGEGPPEDRSRRPRAHQSHLRRPSYIEQWRSQAGTVALRTLTEVITAVVAKGEPVNITGFAKFAKVERPARAGRNPATGEAIRIKASKKARITPLKGYKDAVMTPRQAPKLARGVWSPPAAGVTAKKVTVKKAAVGRPPSKTKKAAARRT